MREGEPLSGKMDLQDKVHPAALLCFGIYWQFLDRSDCWTTP